MSDKLALGSNFFYYKIASIEVSGVTAKAEAAGVVPSLRYDLTSNNKFQVFGEPGIGFGNLWFKPENPSEDNMVFPVDSNYSGLLIYQLGLGLAYNLSRKY